MRKTFGFFAMVGLVGALLAFAMPACADHPPSTNYMEQGYWKVGGELDVISAGILDVKSGGYFKIAGQAVTATAADLNTCSAGTVGTAATACSAVEYGSGAAHKTVITVTFTGTNKFTLADGAHGTGKLMYTFPEGYIQVLGITVTGTLVNTANFNADTADTFSWGIGTATAADDATLSSTEQDLIAVAAVDTASGVTLTRTQTGVLHTVTAWDGTTTAMKAYMNLAIAAANNSDSNDFTFSGTITIVWANLGDY